MTAPSVSHSLIGAVVLALFYALFCIPVLIFDDSFRLTAPIAYFAVTLMACMGIFALGLLVFGLLRAIGEDALAVVSWVAQRRGQHGRS